jgi:hypothetical protein
MHIDKNKLNGEYPPELECQVNSKDCSFTPVHSLCHECGRRLCDDCAVGVRHQPQMFKYTRTEGTDSGRVQLHCPDCADSHEYNPTVLGAGAGALLLGLVLIALLSSASPIFIVVGLIALGGGGYLLYNEQQLKSKLDVHELGS